MADPALSVPTAPVAGLEDRFAAVLAELVGRESVPADADFFADLGADSMVMARFCARVRKQPDLPPVSMQDVYRALTIERLASELSTTPVEQTPATEDPAPPASSAASLAFGAAQLLMVCGYAVALAALAVPGIAWVVAGVGPAETYLRSVVAGAAGLVALSALPVAAKWLLVGRWQPRRIRLWSLDHLRFWVVATLVRTSPLVLFVGSPLYLLHLRALGARVGRGAVILSRHVPVCTDLLTVGAGAVVRKEALFTCYTASAGEIRTGPVTIGTSAYVGEAAVLDIDTHLGDRAQLGHTSSLHQGMRVPDGERRCGSPARQTTDVDHRVVDPLPPSRARRIGYPVAQLLGVIALALPAAYAVAAVLVVHVLPLAAVAEPGGAGLADPAVWAAALIGSLAVFAATVVGGLALVGTLPRSLARAVRPDRTYPLYGIHYWVHRTIARTTNVMFFTYLFGDSSYVVPYLRWLGYDLSEVEQTGSNFGLEFQHETPYLVTIGTGTMVADGLSVINADFTDTSFRVTRVRIGPRNFLGNYVHYPAAGRTGDDCLLATKVAIPVEGAVRESRGLLGSPAFEIPRTVHRDTRFDHLAVGVERQVRLARKNRHNAVTMGCFLLARWFGFFLVLAVAAVAVAAYPALGPVAAGLGGVLALAVGIAWALLVDRAGTAFRQLSPRFCSIYDPYFWWHERHWKLGVQPLLLNGTPFKSLAWRLLGVRMGKRVFDDGCAINEKTLVEIGDDCVLNLRSIIQPHSQEDGTFKSDRISIGASCSLGVGSLVHYGVAMGERSELAADSFLMKGEEIPPGSRWGGNPARPEEHPS